MAKENKKGVSPVIATILLISLTVVIGAIIFMWFRGMTQEAITKSGKNIELTCGEVQLDASYSDGKLYVSNTGNIAIFGLDIKIIEGKSYSTKSIRELSGEWPEQGINQGGSFSGSISIGEAEEIVLIPELIGSSDKGRRTFVCDEGQYGYNILIE